MKSVSVDNVDFLREFHITRDTLFFTHDFSHILSISTGDSIVPRDKYEVPNSIFRIQHLTADSIVLVAANPTAYYVISEIQNDNNFVTGLTEERAIEWYNTGIAPYRYKKKLMDSTLVFYPYASLNNQRTITNIKLTTSCYNMDKKWYSDFYLDSTGTFYARVISQPYSKKKYSAKYFSGEILESDKKILDSLFSHSALPNNNPVDIRPSYGSHCTRFNLEINHNKGKLDFHCTRSGLNRVQRAFFDIIDWTYYRDAYKVDSIDFIFEDTYFEKDQN